MQWTRQRYWRSCGRLETRVRSRASLVLETGGGLGDWRWAADEWVVCVQALTTRRPCDQDAGIDTCD